MSAAAAFFREHMDSCTWAEEPTPKTGTRAQGAPPLLRFPLHPKNRGYDGADAAPPFRSPRGEGGRANELFELVVSRGAGPEFSEHEARTAELAAVLLSQALGRIRDCAALAEAKAALEDSLRSIEEASDAVAVLVEERDRRAQQEARKVAELVEKHGEAMSGVRDALEMARREAEQLRGRLVEAGESLAAIANAAEEACRTISSDVDDADRTDEVVAVIETAARHALRCSSAAVSRRSSANTKQDRSGAKETKEEESLEHTASCLGRGKSGDEPIAAQELHVPIPSFSSSAEPLVLSVCGASSPLRRFTQRDRTAASALAACLCAALLAVSEKKRARRLLRQAEADEEARAKRRAAAAASAAAADAEARKRGERAVAGMRALVVEAQASKAEAEEAAAATRRAERHAEALGHLLLGLSRARSDYAAVARAVYRRASAAVPGCLGAVLLTPRRHRKGAGGTSGLFSPDPRAWATAAASRRGEGVGYSERERDGQGSNAFGRRWAERVQRSAAEAAATGKTVVSALSDNNDDCTGRGGDSRSSRVVCFSPVLALEVSGAESQASASPSGRIRGSELSASSDRMRTSELQGGEMTHVRGGTPCLVGWMLRVGDDDDSPDTSLAAAAAAVSPLTESVMSDAAVGGATSASPAALPTRISTPINAAVHAVSLALAACATATDAAAVRGRASPSSVQPTRRLRSSRRGRDMKEGAGDAGGLSAESTPRRDLELRRLRDGTATLAERVEELEERAAGLRASEARSAAALARARADAGAARGELQLAALELERERRKPLAAAWWVGNLSGGRDGGKEALLGAFRTIPGRSGSVAGFSSNLEHPGGAGGFVRPSRSTIFSTPAGRQDPARSHSLAGVKEGEGGGSEEQAGARPATAVVERVVLPGSPLPSPLAAASSAALQHMASVHARLANSLKNSGFSGNMPRGGTAPAVGVA